MISPESLFAAWDAFHRGKGSKPDVQRFEWHLEENIFRLHRELEAGRYQHGSYAGFYIRDPKQRHVHKASVRDRVLHHAIFAVLNPIFEPIFIPTSFSCRVGYGTHRGVACLEQMTRKVSRNWTRPCYVLKCDVRKFFDSVDHEVLLAILCRRVRDEGVAWLLREVVGSYDVRRERWGAPRKGIPIGNLTSQLFANVYMNEFDQFVKHRLRVKHYARYTDDFLMVGSSREELTELVPTIGDFLGRELALTLHPGKIAVRSVYHGVDFLGYVVLPGHRLLRTKTKRRMFVKMGRKMEDYRLGRITRTSVERSLQSYLGVLSHANAHRLTEKLLNEFGWS